MTYTTQQLQAMSDFEVNQALAVKLGWRLDNGQSSEFTEIPVVRKSCDSLTSTTIDYCNNPSDIMPLAFERGIKLDCVACPAGSGFVYYAKSYDGKLQSDYDSACRAIACLILMMKD